MTDQLLWRDVALESHGCFLHSNSIKDDLGENVYRAVEHSRKAQIHSQQCRKRAEQLIAESERLFTKLKLTNECRVVRVRKGF